MKWSELERRATLDGARAIAGCAFGLFAWGLVSGVAMASSPLSKFEAATLSLCVFGGSIQLASLPLLYSYAPIWTILLTAIMVNVRFIIFSAALQPHFKGYPWYKRVFLGYMNGDLTFAIYMATYSERQDDPLRIPYYLGLAVANWAVWQVSLLLGIFLETAIPPELGASFAGTLALLAVVVPLINRLPILFAAGAAGIVSIATLALPFKLNILIAVVAAMLVGTASDAAIAKKHSAERS